MTKQKPLHVVLVNDSEREEAYSHYREKLKAEKQNVVGDWARKILSNDKEMWMFITPDEAYKLHGYRVHSFCQVGKVYEHERFTDILQILIYQSW